MARDRLPGHARRKGGTAATEIGGTPERSQTATFNRVVRTQEEGTREGRGREGRGRKCRPGGAQRRQLKADLAAGRVVRLGAASGKARVRGAPQAARGRKGGGGLRGGGRRRGGARRGRIRAADGLACAGDRQDGRGQAGLPPPVRDRAHFQHLARLPGAPAGAGARSDPRPSRPARRPARGSARPRRRSRSRPVRDLPKPPVFLPPARVSRASRPRTLGSKPKPRPAMANHSPVPHLVHNGPESAPPCSLSHNHA